MAKRESNFINMVSTLLVITLIAGGLLGLVSDFTSEPIANSRAKAQSDAIASVLPSYDKLGKSIEAGELEIFPAYAADGKFIGAAVKSFTNSGFSGFISIMVGFDAEGAVSGYKVLQHKETPGLGSKMDAWFSNSDKPKQSVIGRMGGELVVSKDGGEVDAITAATISSRAFLDAINLGSKTFAAEKSKMVNPKK